MGTYLAALGNWLCCLLSGACQLHSYQHAEPKRIIKPVRMMSKKWGGKNTSSLPSSKIAPYRTPSPSCAFLLPPIPFFPSLSEVSQLYLQVSLINGFLKELNKALWKKSLWLKNVKQRKREGGKEECLKKLELIYLSWETKGFPCLPPQLLLGLCLKLKNGQEQGWEGVIGSIWHRRNSPKWKCCWWKLHYIIFWEYGDNTPVAS